MVTEQRQAFILHSIWSGETSARITFLTADQGLVTAFYKGGRTVRNRVLLQPFLPLWLVTKQRGSSIFVQSLESVSGALIPEGGALFPALYMNELLFRVLKPGIQSSLFEAYLATLRGLVSTSVMDEVESLLRRFEWTLLCALGYGFSLKEEAETGLPVLQEYHYSFVPGSGLHRVNQGLSGLHLLKMANNEFDDAQTRKAAKLLMRKAIDHLLGGVVIHSRKLYI